MNPALITLPNLINILKIKHHYSFNGILKFLSPDQKILDSLFQAHDTLDKCIWSEDIIKNFKNAGWNIHFYLDAILNVKNNR